MSREISYAQAVNEAQAAMLAARDDVYLMGLGVTDGGGVFGTTKGLVDRFGRDRVMEMPVSENAMTGIAIGSALAGRRPIMVHQRLDFMILAMDQLVNEAAKWHYMFNGRCRVPLTVRLIVGRGWGQGPQHSQSLHAWFAHIPGLKVVMPFSPADAKGLLVAAIEDDNPVVVIEHRWLHNLFGPVPEEACPVPLGQAKIVRPGRDATIISLSYMTLEALRCAKALEAAGLDIEVLDIRSLRPLDTAAILETARRTGRVVVADQGWSACGMAAEILAVLAEGAYGALLAPPVRVTLADCPVPTSPALSTDCYPDARAIARALAKTLGTPTDLTEWLPDAGHCPADVPDKSFMGPF